MSDLSVQLTAPNGRTYAQPVGLFINNEFVASRSGEKFATINPSYVNPVRVSVMNLLLTKTSNEAEITSVYAAGEEDVDIAVKAARKALNHASWKLLPPTERGTLMLKLADLVEQHKETLATIETWDNGKELHIVPQRLSSDADPLQESHTRFR